MHTTSVVSGHIALTFQGPREPPSTATCAEDGFGLFGRSSRFLLLDCLMTALLAVLADDLFFGNFARGFF